MMRVRKIKRAMLQCCDAVLKKQNYFGRKVFKGRVGGVHSSWSKLPTYWFSHDCVSNTFLNAGGAEKKLHGGNYRLSLLISGFLICKFGLI